MGSYITTGFVYDNFTILRLESELKNLIEYLIQYNGIIKNFKASKDRDGNSWIDLGFNKNIEIGNVYSLLAKFYYGQINLECDIFGLPKLKVTVRIETDEERSYFGFLLEISEDELIEFHSINEINNVTENIINFIIKFYNCSKYNYAFCDNEAEIQYSPEEFKSLTKDIYSVVITTLDKKIAVVKSDWNIDGLTTRHN